MHANEALIRAFYSAFALRDADGMIECYHPEIQFSDPVFPNLQGEEAGKMWKMLCARGKDLELTFSDVLADDLEGAAHWQARYTFSGTGRPVLNKIDASFHFADGKIVRHQDRFDLWKWSAMALGLKGSLLGWTPLVQNAIRMQAAKGLDRFQA